VKVAFADALAFPRGAGWLEEAEVAMNVAELEQEQDYFVERQVLM
jgi:hypothetical protein